MWGNEIGADTERIPALDLQFCELIEAVWKCEDSWDQEAHVDAAIKYGRKATERCKGTEGR